MDESIRLAVRRHSAYEPCLLPARPARERRCSPCRCGETRRERVVLRGIVGDGGDGPVAPEECRADVEPQHLVRDLRAVLADLAADEEELVRRGREVDGCVAVASLRGRGDDCRLRDGRIRVDDANCVCSGGLAGENKSASPEGVERGGEEGCGGGGGRECRQCERESCRAAHARALLSPHGVCER